VRPSSDLESGQVALEGHEPIDAEQVGEWLPSLSLRKSPGLIQHARPSTFGARAGNDLSIPPFAHEAHCFGHVEIHAVVRNRTRP
jgi:hypothetical protein